MLFVVFEFHDEGLDVLALALPLLNALLGVRVEVLLLLVKQSLSSECRFLFFLKCVHCSLVLDSSLSLVESREFTKTDALLLLLLLFSELQLFVSGAPEFSKLLLLLLGRGLLLLTSLNLKLTAPLNSELHLHLSTLLLLEESVGLVFSLSDLLVKDLLFVVLNGTELLNLPVNHAATFSLLLSEALRFLLFLHEVTSCLLLSKLFNLLFFLKLPATSLILESDLLLVSFDELHLHLLSTLLSGQLTLLLTLEVLLSLALDELSLEHLLLEALNIIQFEFLKLVRDSLGVGDLVLVLHFELSLHLLVVLLHLVLLHFMPVVVDLLLNLSLSVLQSFLGLLFVVDVAHHHLGLEGLDLVLSLMHVFVSFSKLLITQLVLVVSLFSIDAASFNLFVFEPSNAVILTLLSDSLKSVGPFGYTLLGSHLELLSLHGLVLVG